jgi:hypothetical protein
MIHIQTSTERLENTGGLLVQGRSAFEDIRLFRQSDLFRAVLGLPQIYATETIRLYLEELARDQAILLFPQIEVESWWTYLYEPADDISGRLPASSRGGA